MDERVVREDNETIMDAVDTSTAAVAVVVGEAVLSLFTIPWISPDDADRLPRAFDWKLEWSCFRTMLSMP